jgi:PAP2 superfamily
MGACQPRNKNADPAAPLNLDDAGYLHQLAEALTGVIVYDVFSPPVASRIYAYAHLAAYEALRGENPAVYPGFAGKINGYINAPKLPTGEELNYPLAAAHAFLKVSQKVVFSDTMLLRLAKPVMDGFSTLPLSPETRKNSLAFGDKVADALLLRLQNDQYKETRGFPRYTPGGQAGQWEPTPPEYMDAIEPHWSKILPWTLQSADQFKPQAPTPYDSHPKSLFFQQMEEVYTISRQLSDEQKAIANFWDCNPFVVHSEGHLSFATKKITPGGHWMGIARIACEKSRAEPLKTAQVYTLTALALADAFISCWDEKYRSNYVRPETAIRALKDPKWYPLLQTPPFPEYTSGHSVASTAAATVLTDLFGDGFAYTDSVEVNYGLPPRQFASFQEAAKEASLSRLYGGIHYRPAIDQGIKQGKAVGNHVLSTQLRQEKR